MEKSKRSEATPTAHMKHEDDHGMNGDKLEPLQPQCAHI